MHATSLGPAATFPLLLMLIGVSFIAAPCAQSPQPPDVTVDGAMRSEVIDGALRALADAYVFPDMARAMTDTIRARQQRGEYEPISSGRELAERLTAHLREVSRDQHLSVALIPPGPPLPPPPPGGAQTLEERQRTIAGRQNFGFARVERLAGNVGYLDLRAFMPPALAAETATAAMTFLSSSDALIVDLRQNGGGDPTMVAFLTSYLFGRRAVHLNDFYSRPTNETRASWTLAYVPGRRLPDADVYVLTSSRTFSGAEEFAYNLKHLKRATIVGETTGGGAHTVGGRRINDRFAIMVPSGRPINAVTKSNWEGVGVEPDVKMAGDQALKGAHLLALEKQQQRLGPDAAGLVNEVKTMLQTLRNELGALAPSIPRPDGPSAVPASRSNEDFESGSLSAWRTDVKGAGAWVLYDHGKTSPAPALDDPNFPFDVPDPPQGKRAAIVVANAPGRRILYRDVTLDGAYRLRMSVFYANAGRFSPIASSPQNTISDEQQFRIDLVVPTAQLDTTATEDILATIFRAQPDAPARREPADIVIDLSPWSGRTVRLRVAVADNQGPLRAGIDHIRFEPVGR
jgi:hypothetical protein